MTTMWANRDLLDRLIIAADGEHVGMVDDLELSDEPQPVVTALLSGPTAMGPRIGGRLGTWWLAIGRRMRPTGNPYPNRVPFGHVTELNHRGINLSIDSPDVPTRRLRGWAHDKIIARIPWSGA